jgi:hypothetical protein
VDELVRAAGLPVDHLVTLCLKHIPKVAVASGVTLVVCSHTPSGVIEPYVEIKANRYALGSNE